MKKVLFTAKVDSHIRHFHTPFLKEFKKHGYEVHVASAGEEVFEACDKKFNIEFGTNPFSKRVAKSYKALKVILTENNYDIVHTHTAIASVLTRIACFNVNRKRKTDKSKVIYTAHGFHFLKGGSIANWILFFPIEYILSKMTDVLIVINQEDYKLSERFKMGKKRYLVPGVGVDLEKFARKNLDDLNCGSNFVITYIGELKDNKNQTLLIEAVEKALLVSQDITLNLVGDGDMMEALQELIKTKNLSEHVHMLGYRTDVKDILDCTNLVVSTSKREGLPVNVIESMAMGIPLILTRCRGHVDLVQNDINGFIVDYDADLIKDKILRLKNDADLRERFSSKSLELVNQYSKETVIKKMNEMYGLN